MTRSTVALILQLALLLAAPTYAADDVSEIDFCRDFSIIAKDIMTARQKNKPMSETLPIAIDRIMDWANNYDVDMPQAEAEKMAAKLVMAAYEIPSYGAAGNQRDAISVFENASFQGCYERMTVDSDD